MTTTSTATSSPASATQPSLEAPATTGQMLKQRAAQAQKAATDFTLRNPYKALAIAAGIGFVAGLILKRR